MIDYRSLKLLHRHGDEWVALEPRDHHDPAEHDPEREWGRGRIYECRSCSEEVLLVPDEESAKRG